MPSETSTSDMCRSRGSVMKSLLMAAATLSTLSEAGLARCPDDQYFDADARSCLPCGMCPKNQIIRVPCGPNSDTVCGPFFEFYEFHQAPRPTLDTHRTGLLQDEDNAQERDADPGHDRISGAAGAGQSGSRSPSRETSSKQDHTHRGDGSNGSSFEDLEASQAGENPPLKPQGSGGPSSGRGQQQQPSRQTSGEEENQWKVLALALIIVLCVVCIVLIVFIFIICYLRASRPHLKTALFSTVDASNTGGEQHRTGVPHFYHPVPTRAQAQTATSGTGDRNHVTGTPSGGMVDSAEDQADVQTTASSEYVYFKSPQNGNDAVDV